MDAEQAQRRWRRGLALAWTVAVCWLLWLPGGAPESRGWLPALPAGSDKLIHALLFAVEARLLRRALALDAAAPRALAVAVALAAALAVITELGQRLVPLRGADPADAGADLIGIALYAGWWRWRHLRGPAAAAKTR